MNKVLLRILGDEDAARRYRIDRANAEVEFVEPDTISFSHSTWEDGLLLIVAVEWVLDSNEKGDGVLRRCQFSTLEGLVDVYSPIFEIHYPLPPAILPY